MLCVVPQGVRWSAGASCVRVCRVLAGCAVRQCRAAHLPINCATAACRASPLTTRRLPPAACHLLMGATGALLGARAAIARMQRQQSGGKVFFVDGNGRWGHA